MRNEILTLNGTDWPEATVEYGADRFSVSVDPEYAAVHIWIRNAGASPAGFHLSFDSAREISAMILQKIHRP